MTDMPPSTRNEIQRFPSSLPLPFSRAVRAGGFLFLSGQIPMDGEGKVVRGDIAAQTHVTMDRIGESLALAGASFNDVVKATVWLSDLSLFQQFNEVYQSYFPQGFPVRSAVEAKLAFGVDVEVEVQAWLGGK
ncbi:RidA family protein [Noviherbaspirillum aerium]|uniref:RidA family protein n=1 Tax=Noviherbaspirillum aerium TaxID=2588497 RepID=UPI001CEF8A08|nr:RidA family protein [Noviherbaspirillum aerium]